LPNSPKRTPSLARFGTQEPVSGHTPLAGAFSPGLAGSGTFFALLLSFFDHLDLARGSGGLGGSGGFLFFRARRGDGEDGICLSPTHSIPGGP